MYVLACHGALRAPLALICVESIFTQHLNCHSDMSDNMRATNYEIEKLEYFAPGSRTASGLPTPLRSRLVGSSSSRKIYQLGPGRGQATRKRQDVKGC